MKKLRTITEEEYTYHGTTDKLWKTNKGKSSHLYTAGKFGAKQHAQSKAHEHGGKPIIVKFKSSHLQNNLKLVNHSGEYKRWHGNIDSIKHHGEIND